MVKNGQNLEKIGEAGKKIERLFIASSLSVRRRAHGHVMRTRGRGGGELGGGAGEQGGHDRAKEKLGAIESGKSLKFFYRVGLPVVDISMVVLNFCQFFEKTTATASV